MPGSGATTPIIVGDNVFVASNDEEAKKVVAICLNRADGEVRWSHVIGPTKRFPRNTMVACSPTSDGKRVFFMFSDGSVAGFEVGGKPLWKLRVHDHADMAIQFGYTCSPVLVEDRLIVQVLQNPKQIYRHFKHNPQAKRPSFLLALDAATGKEVYQHIRAAENAVYEAFESYASPVLHRNGGKQELLVLGGDCLSAHDPFTGKERWRWGSYNPQREKRWRQVAGVTPGEGVICIPLPRGTATVGIRPEGGTPKAKPPLWRHEDINPDVCYAAWYKERFYLLDGDQRTLSCLEPKTGRKLWTGKLSDQGIIRASPIAADGRIYTIAESPTDSSLSARASTYTVSGNAKR
jgi:outer membrane protein assembly factor BamB